MEDGLGLSTITGLLSVVAALTLRRGRVLSLLVLSHLVRATAELGHFRIINAFNSRVLLAGLSLAVLVDVLDPTSSLFYLLDSQVRRVLKQVSATEFRVGVTKLLTWEC